MKPLSLLCAVLVLTGCDGVRNFSGPAERQHTFPAHTFRVTYEVTGSYAACDVAYVDTAANEATVSGVPLPWAHAFKITIRRSLDLSVQATCRHPSKVGKSQLHLLVDDQLKGTGSTAGYNATAVATYVLQPE